MMQGLLLPGRHSLTLNLTAVFYSLVERTPHRSYSDIRASPWLRYATYFCDASAVGADSDHVSRLTLFV